MLKNTWKADLPYLRAKFQNPVFDPASGLENSAVMEGIKQFFDDTVPHAVLKAKAFAYICRNMQIDVSPQDFFPAFGCWDRRKRPILPLIGFFTGTIYKSGKIKEESLHALLGRTGASNIWRDFDHSVPDWDRILKLGFPGMQEEARRFRRIHEEKGTLTPKHAAYFDGIELCLTAIFALLDRFISFAGRYHTERTEYEVRSLKALRTRAPQNTYEVLQFIYLYFMICEHIDHYQVRSLGNLDNMLLPYIEKDLAEGVLSEADIRLLFDYFLMQWGSINNYWGHPFYLGGTDEKGRSRINKVTRWLLEEFEKLSIPSPKIQIKVAENTPDEFLDLVLSMIRRSHSSIVFVGEESIARTLCSLGFTEEEARTSGIRGCYELFVSGRHHSNGTGCGHLNMLKPIEIILNQGKDPLTGNLLGVPVPRMEGLTSFESFYENYLQQLRWIVDSNIKVVNDFERFLDEFNPANLFSASVEISLEKGEDAFATGCFRNNTELMNTGFGNAVDALCMIREYVYRKKELSLEKLRDILNADWKGYEELRQKILHDPVKWGNGVEEADLLAEKLGHEVSKMICGRPNARGGSWSASLHSAKQYFEMGKDTGATPDGRFAHEEMSKNMSPVQGMDRNGITGLLRSAEHMDCKDFPGGMPLDVMLHPSTVAGEEGLAAWRILLRHYFAHHGHAIQFNIFDAETLKAAQKEPEKYSELQIRVCGWNVRFTTMDKVEQDKFILRAENIAE